MLRKVEKTAKNVNEAVEAAAKDLGVTPEEVGYSIIRESNKGLMKLLLGSEVEISAWIKAEKESEDRKNNVIKKDTAKVNIKKEDTKPAKKEAKESEKKTAPVQKPAAVETSSPKKVKEKEEQDILIKKETVDDAKYFLSELLNKIGLKHELHLKLEKNEIRIVITGDKMGLLIGNHGKTLDSIQFLTNLYVNRQKKNYVKVSIDTENYRKKREETLINLARSMARTVIRTNKSLSLEPMSANQRRIIHMALQNNPKIKTYSVGEEPKRHIVVALADRSADERAEKAE